MHYFLKFIFGIKLYMFRTVPLSIIGSSPLLVSRIKTEFLPDPVLKLSANVYDIYHCCVYSEKLMTDRGTVGNM